MFLRGAEAGAERCHVAECDIDPSIRPSIAILGNTIVVCVLDYAGGFGHHNPMGASRTFRKADLDRAIRSVVQAGERVGGITIRSDGAVVISTVTAPTSERNDLDRWRADRAARAH